MDLSPHEAINHIDPRVTKTMQGTWLVWWMRGSTRFSRQFTHLAGAKGFILRYKKTENYNIYLFLKDLYAGKEGTNYTPWQ